MMTDPSLAAHGDPNLFKVVNVTFSHDSYSLVKDFITKKGIDEEVEFACDAMHLGPIEYSSISFRREWLEIHFGIEITEDQMLTSERTYAALKESIEHGIHMVAWVNTNDSVEYANFLHWIDRCDPKNILLARPDFPGRDDLNNPAADPVTIMNSIRESAELIQPDLLNRYREQWAGLKSENAAFRLFDEENNFRSFSIDAFDQILISSISADWDSMPEILLRAIRKCWATKLSIPGDLIFCHRIIELAKHSPGLEMRGDSSAPMQLEFRSIS
ncbi:DUF1835 domain-containing protein [Trinickia violacea]|uniref:DUF1835 domain-containing protein n=1 Tax=Trinickia violacea TaxID=2571746 RepID=A0A4P8IZW5_9BURK|nr:DUF3658 domain-containing protein [Trinickia violacea]QCP54026.1 DUF1835 domain-containing protein [Trinickia violacea]